jgi:hypothetical protein
MSDTAQRWRPFVEVRDEMGAEKLVTELRANRFIARWHDDETDELHEISVGHWYSDKADRTIREGLIYNRPPRKLGLLRGPRTCVVFVAPRGHDQAASRPGIRHPAGRPAVHDWEAAAIEAGRFIYYKGLPKTQAELVRHLLEWFGENGPADSDVKAHVRRFMQAYKKPMAEN